MKKIMSESKKISVKLSIKTAVVKHTFETIINELPKFSLDVDDKATHVDILVLEVGQNLDVEFEAVRSFLQDGVVGTVFLTSALGTPEILLNALRYGAREFFQQPVNHEEVVAAFAKAADQMLIRGEKFDSRASGKIITVLGTKGGVGTATVALNCAVGLKALHGDKDVALVDMNRMFGDIPLFLDLKSQFSWEELAGNIERLDSVFLKKALLSHSTGIYVAPPPAKLESAVGMQPEVIRKLLSAMRSTFDYIVIDTGVQINDTCFKIFGISDEIFMVSILNLQCLVNVKRINDALISNARVDPEKIKFIINRFQKKNYVTAQEAERISGKKIYFSISNDYANTMKAINEGRVISDAAPKAKICKEYIELAAYLDGQPPGRTKKRRHWLW